MQIDKKAVATRLKKQSARFKLLQRAVIVLTCLAIVFSVLPQPKGGGAMVVHYMTGALLTVLGVIVMIFASITKKYCERLIKDLDTYYSNIEEYVETIKDAAKTNGTILWTLSVLCAIFFSVGLFVLGWTS